MSDQKVKRLEDVALQLLSEKERLLTEVTEQRRANARLKMANKRLAKQNSCLLSDNKTLRAVANER